MVQPDIALDVTTARNLGYGLVWEMLNGKVWYGLAWHAAKRYGIVNRTNFELWPPLIVCVFEEE